VSPFSKIVSLSLYIEACDKLTPREIWTSKYINQYF
jgi:hypothetical protein